MTRDLEGSHADPPHWGRLFRLIDVDKPQGNVVMNGAEDKPLLVLNRVDKGRVALLLSDNTWLWARGFEGGGPHVDLLRRLAHWLMKEPDLEEEALRAKARAGELTIERQTMADTTEPVTVRKPSGATETVTLTAAEPGLWRATIAADEIGLYRLDQGDKHAFASVGPANPTEFVDAHLDAGQAASRSSTPPTGASPAWPTRSGALDLPRIVPVRSTRDALRQATGSACTRPRPACSRASPACRCSPASSRCSALPACSGCSPFSACPSQPGSARDADPAGPPPTGTSGRGQKPSWWSDESPPRASETPRWRPYFRLNCGRRGESDGAIASVLWRKLIRPFSRS